MASTKFIHRWTRAGESASLQPFVATHARMYGFLFEGTTDAIERYCARWLDRSADGGPVWEPVSHYLLVTFTHIEGVTAQDEPFKDFGINPEREVTVWIPVRERGSLHIAMFTPYCLLDNPLAVQHGREIYGFPKEMARFPRWTDDSLEVEAYAFKRFAPETVGQMQPVMAVTRIRKPPVDWIPRVFDEMLAVARGLNPALELLPKALWPPHGPLVFLKQVPDSDDGSLAAYQALVEAEITLGGVPYTLHHLPGDYALTLYDVDSHPFETDLGLANGARAIIDFYTDFDFTLGRGVVKWKA